MHAAHTVSSFWLVGSSMFAASTIQPRWVLGVFSQTCCHTSPTSSDFRRWGFFESQYTVCMLKQWRHGAMVGWGNGWLNCIVIYMQKWNWSICIKGPNPLMMACIYTNTQTCTCTVHTEYLHTCTYTHICFSLDKIWVGPDHCDQSVGLEAK